MIGFSTIKTAAVPSVLFVSAQYWAIGLTNYHKGKQRFHVAYVPGFNGACVEVLRDGKLYVRVRER